MWRAFGRFAFWTSQVPFTVRLVLETEPVLFLTRPGKAKAGMPSASIKIPGRPSTLARSA
ncbi:hypothetical protein X738_31830 [Mesorhizobium sp. LNHC209A00]|nr:hypothetical protein X738_31830 [Mesorhizobium sp. LNHC209A00]ESY89808.1 hypothetical protein X741_29830 [Mesorhizobium sp. LNHC229A00]